VEPELLRALFANSVMVLDGGLATQLEAQGADLADPLWSARLLVEHREEIVRAHLAFYRAGARVATTASYQATFEGFARRGIGGDEAAALLRRSVELAATARDRYRGECGDHDPDPLLVAASIGPYGAYLADGSEYRGRYGRSVRQLADFHRGRLVALAASDADVLACETIPELAEAEALVRLLGAVPGVAAWLAFTCEDGGRLCGGAPIEEAVELADEAPAVLAVGVNCTAPEHVDELIARVRSVTAKPIVVYPNSGEGWDAAARRWSEPGGMVTDGIAARRWVAAGATLVGGCCRVTPARIAEMAAAIG
jgi:homocysteine S-methyltransferase